MRAFFVDERPGIYVGKLRCGWSSLLHKSEDENWLTKYDAELFVIDDDLEEQRLEIKNVANGESFYINIGDIVKLITGKRHDIIIDPILDGQE